MLDAAQECRLDACGWQGPDCAGAEELEAPEHALSWPGLLLMVLLGQVRYSALLLSVCLLRGPWLAAVKHCWCAKEWLECGDCHSPPDCCFPGRQSEVPSRKKRWRHLGNPSSAQAVLRQACWQVHVLESK